MFPTTRQLFLGLTLGLLAACGRESRPQPTSGKPTSPKASSAASDLAPSDTSARSATLPPAPAGDLGSGSKPIPTTPPTAKPEPTPQPETASAPAAPACKQGNDLQVVFSEKEQHKIEGFEVTHRSAYYSGMYYNGKTLARLAYVVFANYEHDLGRWGLTPSKGEGEVAVVVSFKTPSMPSTLQEQKAKYASLALEVGEYTPGWMDAEQIFQVTYYPGGGKGGPAISSDGTGTATVTQATDDHICGTIEFVSPKGTTIRGEFSVPIQGDLWKK